MSLQNCEDHFQKRVSVVAFFIRSHLLLAGVSALFFGCATASKDIHFRSRLPTQDVPFIPKSSSHAFHFNVQAENSRFTFQPTNNLVANYNLGYETIYYSGNSQTINGLDLSLGWSYSADFIKIPLDYRFNASFDFVTVDVNLIRLLQLPKSWHLSFTGGQYRTSSYTSSGASGCFLFCSQSSREDAELKESKIGTRQGGSEQKLGGTVGYFVNEKNLVALSYNWMNYSYFATVTKEGSPDLNLNERFAGYGYGIGYYNMASDQFMIGFTVDAIQLNFRSKPQEKTVFGLRISSQF